MGVFVRNRGTLKRTKHFLKKAVNKDFTSLLNRYGVIGVDILQRETPKLTGKTSESWYYKVSRDKTSWILSFNNSNIINEVPIAIILQYGHGTKNGSYVQGIDYLNPAIRPLFEDLSKQISTEVHVL